MPAPPYLDHHPGALAAASVQESPSPASPRLHGAMHAGCTPLQTPGLGVPRFRPQGWGRRAWVTKTAHLSRFCM